MEMADREDIYCLPFKICRDTYTQTFQYKINHRYISCNYNLFNLKIIESPAWTYCPQVDTLEHHFFNCERGPAFWLGINTWLKNITLVDIKLTLLEALSFVYNLIILRGKLYIYTCNKDDKDLNIPEFLNKLKYYIMTEKQISNKVKLEFFYQKY